MNILLVGTTGRMNNGASRSLLNLATYVRNTGNRIVVLLERHGALESILEELDIPHYVIKYKTPWRIQTARNYPRGVAQRIRLALRVCYDRFITDAQVKDIVDKHSIDLVHINASTTCAAAAVALRGSKKLVWHIREFMEEDLDFKFVDARKSLRLMGRADCVVAISNSVYEKYAGRISARMLKIYNGVDVQAFYGLRETFAAEPVRIVISGRVARKKGHATLLKALDIMKRSGYGGFECHILGDLLDKQYAEELAAYASDHGMDQQVFFHGHIDGVSEWLRKMDVLCLCSVKEAFGLSTVEGMLSGCLVIGSNTGGTPEIITDNVTGLLYASGDDDGADALAERLMWAMRNPEKAREIALQGQEHALNNFSAENTQKKIVRLYETLLG